ncbi:MAG: hypothetical protein ACRDT8_00305 [Micromonosporaceae bacterium]
MQPSTSTRYPDASGVCFECHMLGELIRVSTAQSSGAGAPIGTCPACSYRAALRQLEHGITDALALRIEHLHTLVSVVGIAMRDWAKGVVDEERMLATFSYDAVPRRMASVTVLPGLGADNRLWLWLHRIVVPGAPPAFHRIDPVDSMDTTAIRLRTHFVLGAPLLID